MASLSSVVRSALDAHKHGNNLDNPDADAQDTISQFSGRSHKSRNLEVDGMPNGHTKSFMDSNKQINGTAEPPLAQSDGMPQNGSKSLPQLHNWKPHFSQPHISIPDTPSSRTGPPRSYSYQIKAYGRSPRLDSGSEDDDDRRLKTLSVTDSRPHFQTSQTTSDFRGALDFSSPAQREKEKVLVERRGRIRQAKLEDSWSPLKRWGLTDTISQTPMEEATPAFQHPTRESYFEKEKSREKEKNQRGGKMNENGHVPEKEIKAVDYPSHSSSSRFKVSSSQSFAQSREDGRPHPAQKWNRLRSLIPTLAHRSRETSQQGQTAVQSNVVNITDELIAGGLSTLILGLWFERDEHGNRRVPVLLHRLRIRISDSLHPLNGNKAVFRIECEYANGAARWVIYRQLRDFISLHTHYRFSNAFNRNVDVLPEFPRTSLPYFKFLKSEGREHDSDVSRSDFAPLQRQALENYLISLIRAVMFHPTSNRLAGFLEISGLSIALAQSGGWQVKAGNLKVEPASSKSGTFGRKNSTWTNRKRQRWCAVRESYLVALEDPGESTIWDVFLLDTDFKIERPSRYYRQGLNLLQSGQEGLDKISKDQNGIAVEHEYDHHSHSTLQKIKEKLHLGSLRRSVRSDRKNNETSGGHDREQSGSSGSGIASSSTSRSPTPMGDPSTNMDPMHDTNLPAGETEVDLAEIERNPNEKKKKSRKDMSRHTFVISNAQTRLKLYARNERQMEQWITALEKTAANSHWTGSNRFGSFAPIRLNVAAQWLVDGRDYMWNLSRAISLARERIYIHGWWLSPELQMRRPGPGFERYRLDRLLERKAKEGVKIFIILYKEVSNRTTPVDSNYTKQTLQGLHENIMVQRSPSHFQTGTFYWAHHEKICIIDEAIAFMGGIDLCFGRWDSPQHVLIDNPESETEENEQIWPGKDYSNARVCDFHTLTKPDQDMYDRARVPRMPWHDVGMNVVGQPARDLCRHFVERWNYLLRIKNHTKILPFLLPPPDFKPSELTEQGLTGTCEMQICRSAGPWSLGTLTRVEHSIQNAYLKAIQLSEHFVYIENQFFVTSTIVNDVVIENKIGDALVDRIIRAYREGTKWKACIMIPLLPGFPFPVDHSDASAVRIILECQNRTISRGPDSLFARIRKEGIDPNEYISVFSLRNWGRLHGDVLTTEMVYIHGKVCIVDDRLAIIGSANINERSQRGDRDSEVIAVIRDTDMLDGSMNGKPYKVGRFAHTLRVRLMREHLGVDVDDLYEEDLTSTSPVKEDHAQTPWDPDDEQQIDKEEHFTEAGNAKFKTPAGLILKETTDGLQQAIHATGEGTFRDVGYFLRKAGIKSKGIDGSADDKRLEEERQTYTRSGEKVPGFTSAVVPTLEEKTILEHRPPSNQADRKPLLDEIDQSSEQAEPEPSQRRVHDGSRELFGAPADASKSPRTDDEPPHARSDKIDASNEEEAAVKTRSLLRKHLSVGVGSKTWTLPTPAPNVDPHGFEDPVCDEFWKNVWVACAVHNTEIYRKVFHAIPDDLVTTWKQYKEFIHHHERLNKPPKDQSNVGEPLARMPSEAGDEQAPKGDSALPEKNDAEDTDSTVKLNTITKNNGSDLLHTGTDPEVHEDSHLRQPSRANEPFERWEREEMEGLLHKLRGHLVVYPLRFLEGEDVSNNFLFNADRLLPMPIYN